jgi:hypothetical protein
MLTNFRTYQLSVTFHRQCREVVLPTYLKDQLLIYHRAGMLNLLSWLISLVPASIGCVIRGLRYNSRFRNPRYQSESFSRGFRISIEARSDGNFEITICDLTIYRNKMKWAAHAFYLSAQDIRNAEWSWHQFDEGMKRLVVYPSIEYRALVDAR